jgi:hypothetical protein
LTGELVAQSQLHAFYQPAYYDTHPPGCPHAGLAG